MSKTHTTATIMADAKNKIFDFIYEHQGYLHDWVTETIGKEIDDNFLHYEQVRSRLPGDYAEQVFTPGDARLQLSSLVSQYHNEKIFADNAENILMAVKNNLTDAYLIRQIEDVLSNRIK